MQISNPLSNVGLGDHGAGRTYLLAAGGTGEGDGAARGSKHLDPGRQRVVAEQRRSQGNGDRIKTFRSRSKSPCRKY
ncbi:hypothetical protein J6590_080290 [Homalodisca vitripennis]|nr:hypothetical protein J6590_080290 [Homalodisca vitripennis]